MTSATCFSSTLIGRKVVMAVTGLILVGFVVGHMFGNLQVFLGADALNEYSESLRHILHGFGLWIARIVLLGAVALHIWASISLTRESRAARDEKYIHAKEHRASTYASRTMIWSGPIIALFVIYHILHFTTGTVHPDFEPGAVYHNVVAGFSIWPISIFYIVAMLGLGLHMYHGIWSMLQTVGLSHPRWNHLRFAVSAGTTIIVVLGNISMPVAVMIGFVR